MFDVNKPANDLFIKTTKLNIKIVNIRKNTGIFLGIKNIKKNNVAGAGFEPTTFRL